jgi:hypothetical protein
MDALVLFSSRYGFWCSDKGWVDSLNDAEFYRPETTIVAGFKNRIDVEVVNINRCRVYLAQDFIDECLPYLNKAGNEELKEKVYSEVNKQNTSCHLTRLFNACALHVPEAVDTHFFKAKNSITLFPKNSSTKADKVCLVAPYISKRVR